MHSQKKHHSHPMTHFFLLTQYRAHILSCYANFDIHKHNSWYIINGRDML